MKKFGDIKIGSKLISAFLIIGILPLAILGFMATNLSNNALSAQAFNQLEAVRQIKKTILKTISGPLRVRFRPFLKIK